MFDISNKPPWNEWFEIWLKQTLMFAQLIRLLDKSIRDKTRSYKTSKCEITSSLTPSCITKLLALMSILNSICCGFHVDYISQALHSTTSLRLNKKWSTEVGRVIQLYKVWKHED